MPSMLLPAVCLGSMAGTMAKAWRLGVPSSLQGCEAATVLWKFSASESQNSGHHMGLAQAAKPCLAPELLKKPPGVGVAPLEGPCSGGSLASCWCSLSVPDL